MTHTRESLIAFRDRVKAAFLNKEIRCPIHLPSDTQAEPLLEIFSRFRQGQDWCFSNWRSLWHALLAGIPEDALFDVIAGGRSMFICSKQHKFYSSSIVAGALPIAAGVALGIKRRGDDSRVFVCCGDMTARTGLYHEFREYCGRNDLPVRIVIEDNSLSTDTPTKAAWGDKEPHESEAFVSMDYYRYERMEAHVGVGQFVNFF